MTPPESSIQVGLPAPATRKYHAFNALMVIALLACNRSQPTPNEQAVTAAESSRDLRRFVVFRQPTLVLESIETPIPPPVTVGSTLAGDLLSSSEPSIVSVDSFGNLIGHKNGTAIVRGSAGAVLQVVVNAVGLLRVVPGHVELLPGGRASLEITGDGRELPAGSYRWDTTSPNTAVASGSTVYAGSTPGTATLTLRSGDATSTLTVTVRAPTLERRLERLRNDTEK